MSEDTKIEKIKEECDILVQKSIQAFEKKKYREALDLSEKCLNLKKSLLNENHIELVYIYENKAVICDGMKNYKCAISNYEKALSLLLNDPGDNDIEIASDYNQIGLLYKTMKEYTKAIGYFNKSLAIRIKKLGLNHKDTGYSYANLAWSYIRMNQYEKYIFYYEKYVAILKNISGENSKDLLAEYKIMAKVSSVKKKFNAAIKYMKKVLAIQKKILGVSHPDILKTYKTISWYFEKKYDYNNAIKYFEKYLTVKKKIIPEETREIIEDYKSIVPLYVRLGNYNKPIEYYQKIIAFQERHFGIRHKETLQSYFRISNLYQLKKDYDSQILYLNKVLEASTDKIKWYRYIASANRLKDDDDTALAYYNKALSIAQKDKDKRLPAIYQDIAEVYFVMENPKETIEYYKKAAESAEILWGKEDKKTLAIYDELSVKYGVYGYHAKGLHYLKKSLNIKEKLFDENSIELARSYSYITSFYLSMNEYEKALKYNDKSLKIREKVLGKHNKNFLGEYNNKAYLYHMIGENEKALMYLRKTLEWDTYELVINETYEYFAKIYMSMKKYKKALNYYMKIVENKQRVKSVMVATTYMDIGVLYKKKGDYASALKYFKKAEETSHDNAFQMQIANVYKKIGSYEDALSLYLEILHTTQEKYGAESTYVMRQKFTLGQLYKTMGNYRSAYKHIEEAFHLFLKIKDEMFVILNTKQKNTFLKTNESWVNSLLDVTQQYGNEFSKDKKKTYQRVLDLWLNYKGSIFDSENLANILYMNLNDKVLKDKIITSYSYKRKLAKLYQTLPSPKERDLWSKKVKQTEKQIAKLNSDIASKAEVFKEYQGLKQISYKDISKYLKENELYIDYAKTGENYYIFTLDHNAGITFVKIDTNSTEEIERLVKEFRANIDTVLTDKELDAEKITALTNRAKKSLSRLYELVLAQPLASVLQSKKRLIVSTDGLLRLLPFEAMYDMSQGKYLIEEKNIRYIPSGKELVRLYKYVRQKKKDNTIIFSDPDFNTLVVDKRDRKKEKVLALTPSTSRAGIVKSLFRMQFSPLPGTKAEAETIRETLKDKNVTEYTRLEANELNLIQLKSPKILHIATHGFFINDDTVPNPMLKSGIALSGANKSVIRGKNDGVVTALKLSGLDLKGTELVVLSACQTGVVDSDTTENVSGLSKAFIQAGAKDIVMSLWSVDDNATKELMGSFYKEMQGGEEYAEALKRAKLKMIEKGMHPFFWAPFIVSGM
jgi:CHAT domain-containing protein/lipopolysaccharide biosynthesis regulator YciM